MDFNLITLDGTNLDTAKLAYDSGKNNLFIEIVVDKGRSLNVYYKELDHCMIDKSRGQLMLSVTKTYPDGTIEEGELHHCVAVVVEGTRPDLTYLDSEGCTYQIILRNVIVF